MEFKIKENRILLSFKSDIFFASYETYSNIIKPHSFKENPNSIEFNYVQSESNHRPRTEFIE